MADSKVTSDDLLLMQDKDQHDPTFEHEAQITIVQQLEALVAAVDRNTEAIYNTAKVQSAGSPQFDDTFIFAINTAIEGFRKTNCTNMAAALVKGLREVEKARQS